MYHYISPLIPLDTSNAPTLVSSPIEKETPPLYISIAILSGKGKGWIFFHKDRLKEFDQNFYYQLMLWLMLWFSCSVTIGYFGRRTRVKIILVGVFES